MKKMKFLFLAATILLLARCGNDVELSQQPVDQKTGDQTTLANARAPRYPNYNTSPQPPNQTGMTSDAATLAARMNLGINIGNTLEAIGGETAWGNPLITKALIDSYKQAGFNAIRIPCSWDQYANRTTAEIQAQWLERVKTVIQYCIDDGMYVILNIHWDGGWLDGNINTRSQASVNAKQKAFWEQIATKMRDFDEHLLFASANEPPVEDANQMNILLSYHQTFVNAVRSTGGRNSYRVLVIQGPSTDIEKTNSLMNSFPTDQVANRLMAEVHYYTPYQFCLMSEDASWGKMFYYWGTGHHSTIEPDRNATWGEEADVVRSFGLMKTKFVDKGIPVVLGEYGAYRRDGSAHVPLDLPTHNDAVDYWAMYVTKQAKANGILPFWWDTGGMLDRTNYTIKDQRTLNALQLGAQ
jgi:endoglucanase